MRVDPPRAALGTVCTSRRRARPQTQRDEKREEKEGAQAGGGLEVRHAVGYIPCLATISIGQH